MTVSRTVCLGFLAVIFVGALLLMLPISTANGSGSDFLTGLFMSTSAVCVTGLAVVDVGKYYSFWGQFFLALLAQIGGLGYMTATTFLLLLLGRKFGLKDKIAIQQSLDQPGLAGAADLIRSIIATTAIFELTGAFLLMLVFVPELGWQNGIWFAIFHSVSAFNNAGFGLKTDNLMSYVSSPIVTFTIGFLIIFGGIGYQVIMEMYLWVKEKVRRDRHRSWYTLQFKIAVSTTVILLAFGTIAFFLTELNNPNTLAPLSLGDKWLAAWFQSVTPRTAGFNTIDIGKMTETGLFITIALMFIGASPGGTGGGIKTTTFRILYSCTKAALLAEEEVVSFKRQISIPLVLKAVGVFFGSLLVVIISTIIIELNEPETKFQFLQILFEVVSAFGTVGLSTGITASVSAVSKTVLIATMYIGRVGVLLLMSSLIGNPNPRAINYPEENLLVG
ncbi:TrkH family potassium uptake protein [Merismopedia glauca]|uniref:ATPase n=1 Tax=Merismopedia glauca CCAP 1448/3 TaxID=1296344 RepID=A0A2T1C691_9CYAN|nr:TrkH family potassium uptake protein [Merismopedia glauca]PSB03790.1 ATPase [Merismopedia glauca CCAP 1448/3]